MNKLKLVLAWLDWSTYCQNDGPQYEFPKSLCQIFWRTLFSIIALPITWFTHLWNGITVKNKHFTNENSDGHKLTVGKTIIFTLSILASGGWIYNTTDGENGLGWDLFHISDPFLLNYFKLI